jgi:hypothetical protein
MQKPGEAGLRVERKLVTTSATPLWDELLRGLATGDHLTIKSMTRVQRQLPGGGADDGAPAVMDGYVEAEIAAIHGQAPPVADAAVKGSTSL